MYTIWLICEYTAERKILRKITYPYCYSLYYFLFFSFLSFFNAGKIPTKGFPGGASGKEHAFQRRRCKRPGFNPWVRGDPWRRAQQPLQYSCLENPTDRGARQVTVNRVRQSRTRLQKLSAVQHACSRYSALHGAAFQHCWMIHNKTHWTLWSKHNWNTFHKIILTFIVCDALWYFLFCSTLLSKNYWSGHLQLISLPSNESMGWEPLLWKVWAEVRSDIQAHYRH